MAAHVPYILAHLAVRLGGEAVAAAATAAPVPVPAASASTVGGAAADGAASSLMGQLSAGLAQASTSAQQEPQVQPKPRLGGRSFGRRQLILLAHVAEAAFAARGTEHGDAAAVAATFEQLARLLLPFLRARRPDDAHVGDGLALRLLRGGGAGGGAQAVRALLDAGDMATPVLYILTRLLPLLRDPAYLLPVLVQQLAPGAHALHGAARAMLMAALAAFGEHGTPQLRALAPGLALLQRLAALHSDRLGEMDVDAILAALDELSAPALLEHAVLAAGGDASAAASAAGGMSAPGALRPLLPAFVFQAAYLLLENDDMAVRAAASSCLAAFAKTAGRVAVAGWHDACARAQEAATAADEAAAAAAVAAPAGAALWRGPAVPDQHRAIVDVAAPGGSGCTPPQHAPAALAALHVGTRTLAPIITAALQTSSPSVRASFITLLAELVRAFCEFGLLRIGGAGALASGEVAEASGGRVTAAAALMLARSLGVGAEHGVLAALHAARMATAVIPVRLIGNAHLHADLAQLVSDTDPEADVFVNLTHLQLHRRARAFTRLASLAAGASAASPCTFSAASLRGVLLPLALQVLHDEAGGGDAFVVVKAGRNAGSARFASAGGAGAYAGGMHTEAVRLIGAVAARLPWHDLVATLRGLVRQADAAAGEAAALTARAAAAHAIRTRGAAGGSGPTPYAKQLLTLERLLIRAIGAMVEALPAALASVRVSAAPVPAPAQPRFRVDEAGLVRNLITAIDTQGGARHTIRLACLAVDGLDGDGDGDGDDDHVLGRDDDDAGGGARSGGGGGDSDDDDAASAVADGELAGDAISAAAPKPPERHGRARASALPAALAPEASRRAVLLDIAAHILPALWRFLFKRPAAAARPAGWDPDKRRARGTYDDTRELGSAAGQRAAEPELRPHIALCLVRLLHLLPAPILPAQLPRLFAQVCSALRSREQGARDAARATLARVAGAAGPHFLGTLLPQLRQALHEGYQVHVVGHALHAVMVALAPAMVPTAPHLPAALAAALAGGSGAAAPVEAGEANGDAGGGGGGDDGENSGTAGAAALVQVLPVIMEMVLDDMLGEASEARAASSGYVPRTAVKESKSCASPATVEIVAACIPFLPSPAVHALTAPLLAVLARGDAGVAATGVAGDSVAASAHAAGVVDQLLRRISAGLMRNPSLTPHCLLLYVHGLASQFLRVPADVTAPPAVRAAAAAATAAAAAAVAAARSPAAALLDKWLLRGGGASGAGTALRPVAVWTAHGVAPTVARAAPASAALSGVPAHLVSGAMRQRTSTAGAAPPTAHPTATFDILPEPRMTSSGRYAAAAAAAGTAPTRGLLAMAGSGAASAADVPLGVFALGLLQSALRRRTALSLLQPPNAALLAPLVPLLAYLLGGAPASAAADAAAVAPPQEARVVVAALRCLTLLLPAAGDALPAVASHAPALAAGIFRAVEATAGGGGGGSRSGGSDADVADIALRAAATAVACPHVRVGDAQLCALLSLLRSELTPGGSGGGGGTRTAQSSASRQGACFALLRAILARRLLTADLYDTMEAVARLLITALRPAARRVCAAALLTFLLHYPMTEARLREFTDFFLRNACGYAGEDGRLSALDMLAALVARLPVPVLDDNAAYLVLPLALRLVQDPASAARAAVGALLMRIFATASGRTVVELAELVCRWLATQDNAALRRTAAQVVGLVAEARFDALLGGGGAAAAAAPAAAAAAAAAAATVAAEPALLPRIFAHLTRELRDAAAQLSAAEAALDAGESVTQRRAILAAPGSGGGGTDVDGGAAAAAASDSDEDDMAVRHAAVSSSRLRAVAPDGNAAEDGSGEGAAEERLHAAGSRAQRLVTAEEQPEDEASAAEDEASDEMAVAAAAVDVAPPAISSAPQPGLRGDVDEHQSLLDDGDERAATATAATNSSSRTAAGSRAVVESVVVQLPWERPYYALLAVEKLLRASPARCLAAMCAGGGGDGDEGGVDSSAAAAAPAKRQKAARGAAALEQQQRGQAPRNAAAAAADLLLYPHAWVRAAATRVLVLSLAQLQPEFWAAGGGGAPLPPWAAWLAGADELLALARRLVTQLTSALIAPPAAEQTARCLLLLTRALAAAEPDAPEALHAIIGFGCAVGRLHGDVARTAVLQWLAAAVAMLPPATLLPHLPALARLLFRLQLLDQAPARVGADAGAGAGRRSSDAVGVSPAVRELAAEAQAHLQARLGVAAVASSLAAARLGAQAARDERRRARAVLRVANPAAAALERVARRQAAKLRRHERASTAAPHAALPPPPRRPAEPAAAEEKPVQTHADAAHPATFRRSRGGPAVPDTFMSGGKRPRPLKK